MVNNEDIKPNINQIPCRLDVMSIFLGYILRNCLKINTVLGHVKETHNYLGATNEFLTHL
jgi:hypothetical protein